MKTVKLLPIVLLIVTLNAFGGEIEDIKKSFDGTWVAAINITTVLGTGEFRSLKIIYRSGNFGLKTIQGRRRKICVQDKRNVFETSTIEKGWFSLEYHNSYFSYKNELGEEKKINIIKGENGIILKFNGEDIKYYKESS